MLERNCPKCDRKLSYSRSDNRNRAEKLGLCCKSCSSIGVSHKHSKKTRRKMSISKRGKFNPNFGKPLSNEHKRKIRLSTIARIQNRSGQMVPNYSSDACRAIERYGRKHGYNFQHAENGGEFYIKELGYWVDGYDAKRNVVIEFHESRHYTLDGQLKLQDQQRQHEIVEHLECRFVILTDQ